MLAAATVLTANSSADVRLPAEDETFAAFEWFCLAHLNKATEYTGVVQGYQGQTNPR